MKIYDRYTYKLILEIELNEMGIYNLRGADLRCADLEYANLRDANLRDADLRDADLRCADLRDAYLRGANLRDANLRDANLRGADLRCADLRGADLRCADLRGADLNYTAASLQCPEEGEFIAFKKASNYVVKLRVLADSRRSSATSRKCRCDKAEVLGIYKKDGILSDKKEVKSDYNASFIYTVGKIVEEQEFDENRWVECSYGIHFFITFDEAKNYNY